MQITIGIKIDTDSAAEPVVDVQCEPCEPASPCAGAKGCACPVPESNPVVRNLEAARSLWRSQEDAVHGWWYPTPLRGNGSLCLEGCLMAVLGHDFRSGDPLSFQNSPEYVLLHKAAALGKCDSLWEINGDPQRVEEAFEAAIELARVED